LPFLIQSLQTCKPDSVSRLATGGYHLSCCCITATILAAYPSASDEQPFSNNYRNADIRGIAVHKVYPSCLLPARNVSSYLTFSPLSPHFCGDGYFLWHSLPGDENSKPGPVINRCVALYCPDFPSFP